MVHRASIGELGHILGDADPEQPVMARVDDSHGRVVFGIQGKGDAWRAEFSAQLTDGRYPEYTAIIPRSHKTTIGVHAGTLLRAVELVRLFPRDDGGSGALLSADPVANQLRVSANKSQRGDGSDAIDAEVKGAAVELVIDADFLVEILSRLKDAQVVIEASSPTRPISIRPYSASPDEFVHVIMPMGAPKEGK